MTAEIPIWLNGSIRWVSGVDKKTTCRDVVEVLLLKEGMGRTDLKDYTIMERWRRVEKPLDDNSKILKVWSHWGDEKKEVRLCLKRIDTEVDSGRGSPIGPGNTPSLRRRRRSRFSGKPLWIQHETIHPKRLAELGGLDDHQLRRLEQTEVSESRVLKKEESRRQWGESLYESSNSVYATRQDLQDAKKKAVNKTCSGTGLLHSTLLPELGEDNIKHTTSKCCSKRPTKHKGRKSENIEKLMKLILVQGATIQSQLQKLKDREDQIETIEHERHKERLEKNGRNYLLETYLGSLGEAETPPRMEEEDEEKGNDSGVHTEGGSDQMNPARERLQENINKERADKRMSRKGRLKASSNEEGDPQEYKAEEETGSVREIVKTERSRSESRSQRKTEESECNSLLKRTKSESLLVHNEPEKNAKEETEDMIELRRVQSQVELWEKVFKINKKLEKEEENLVRLHISIRRCQSENLKIAKDNESQKVVGVCSNVPTTAGAQDPVQQELQAVERSLESLRSDLDNNSKQIYKNFTQLIDDDDEVENKQKYLSQLMSDLQRTNHEHDMLREMVENSPHKENPPHMENSPYLEDSAHLEDSPHVENSSHLETTVFREPTSEPTTTDIGLSLQVKGQEKHKEDEVEDLSNVTFNDYLPGITGSSQREESVETKPKTVKISFDDQAETAESPIDRTKEPTTTPGAIKSILKNKSSSLNNSGPSISLHNLQKNTMNHGSNIDRHTEKVSGAKDFQETFSAADNSQIYSQPVSTRYNNPIYGENPYRYCFNGRSSFSRKSAAGTVSAANESTVVTTKAVVHNDTDSSTSSDTSGMSSMYSSSPTVEEHPYSQHSQHSGTPHSKHHYVLNTLV